MQPRSRRAEDPGSSVAEWVVALEGWRACREGGCLCMHLQLERGRRTVELSVLLAKSR